MAAEGHPLGLSVCVLAKYLQIEHLQIGGKSGSTYRREMFLANSPPHFCLLLCLCWDTGAWKISDAAIGKLSGTARSV